jgi:predicted anti-sigma-YlaC factor YlaD
LYAVLTCREFVEFLDDYLEGRLPEHVVAHFHEHLATCPSCVSYARSYQDTVRLAGQAFGEDGAVDGVPEELVQAILAARRHSQAR